MDIINTRLESEMLAGNIGGTLMMAPVYLDFGLDDFSDESMWAMKQMKTTNNKLLKDKYENRNEKNIRS
ncbi:MAG: hypothetical protein ACLRV7_06675 [Hoylesella buccalis]